MSPIIKYTYLCFPLVIMFISNYWHRISCEENSTESVLNRIEIFISLKNETEVDNNSTSIESVVNNTIPVPTISDKTLNITSNVANTTSGSDSSAKRHKTKTKSLTIEVLQTNMFDVEVELCRNVVESVVSHEYGSRKTARLLKTELDQIFTEQKYRFTVVISSDVNSILSKSLYGLWISMTVNGKHYFLIASYKAAKTNKLSEAQMDRIEDWTSVYFITYDNMTRQAKFDKVSKMVREKLDLNYGKGNTWGVIAYRHSFAMKGKKLLDLSPHLQFKRLDGSLWFVFRGGENIPTTDRTIKPKIIL